MRIHYKGRKRHDTILREKFGIGLHQYEELYKLQEGKCYICKREESKNLAVDHCHKTQKVRRLLCMDCNTGLGKFKEDPMLLKAALEYLIQEFELPEDKPQILKDHDDKPRWRAIVETPKGTFSSAIAAGLAYGVDPVTIQRWCGAYAYFPNGKREGFSTTRVFASLTEIQEKYNVKN